MSLMNGSDLLILCQAKTLTTYVLALKSRVVLVKMVYIQFPIINTIPKNNTLSLSLLSSQFKSSYLIIHFIKDIQISTLLTDEKKTYYHEI